MYSMIARNNVALIHQFIDIYNLSEKTASSREISDAEIKMRLKNLESRLELLLRNCTVEDLKVIYAIATIGYHERGERHHYSNNTIEIIEMEIKENDEELLNKHSKYIAFLSRQELIDHFLSHVSMSQGFIEGLKILKLS
ncbi:hypothetical protein M3231_01045 [Neobacillus mesonae]|nr:hypothetical protein [Neobacillus mesonae]